MSKKGLKQNFKGGEKFGKWTLLKLKKSSANGVIFYCKNDEGEKKIIKLCKKKTQKAYLRFKIEIEAIKLAAEISGVISILDCQLPPDDFDDESDVVPYYVMRKGEDFFEFTQGQPLKAKVACIMLIANTLSKLHKKKIYHRDIKYSNIIFIDSTPILIDFGVASIPDKPDITGNHTLGPKYTMAPEVQLAESDQRKKIKWDKADVFSLGKTFWIIITEQKRGFTGQYTPGSSLSIKKYISDDNIDILEEALVGATNHSPEVRLNSEQFTGLLLRWYRLKNTKDLSQKFHQWKHIINKIFNFGIPIKAVWDDKHQILDILREIVDTGGVCEMSFPFGGGMSIKKVELNESGEFEVTDLEDYVHVFKSERLEFHSFKKDKLAHYFLVKVKKQKGKLQKEELTEHDKYSEWFIEDINTGLIKGFYEDGNDIEDNDSNKRIIRLWKKGNIMFTGIANDISLTNANYHGFGESSDSKKIKKHIKNWMKIGSKRKLKKELNNTKKNRQPYITPKADME